MTAWGGSAWDRFDRFAGYWLGLDTPKYQKYILEHERLLRLEEQEAMHGKEAEARSSTGGQVLGGSLLHLA